MAKKLEVVSYIRGADGNLIEFSTLTQEEKQRVRKKIAENIGKTIGRYLTEHPEEIEPLSRCESVRLIPDPPEKGAAVC
jgi:hypothetical protein